MTVRIVDAKGGAGPELPAGLELGVLNDGYRAVLESLRRGKVVRVDTNANQVRNAVGALLRMGFEIETVRGEGYRMARDPFASSLFRPYVNRESVAFDELKWTRGEAFEFMVEMATCGMPEDGIPQLELGEFAVEGPYLDEGGFVYALAWGRGGSARTGFDPGSAGRVA